MTEIMNMGGLTPREYYRMHGTLPVSAVEALLDGQEDIGEAPDVCPYLQDARAQFPAEDFLQGIIDRVGQLAKQVRGHNRKEAEGIAEALEAIQQNAHYATEEGLDNLNSAEKELKKWLK